MSVPQPPFDYWPIVERAPLSFPGGARVAFWIGLNIEHFQIDKAATSIFPSTSTNVPDPMNYGWRDYGVRVGVWRMAELFDRFGIRPSVLVNSDACTYYPEIIEAGRKRGWPWLAHGKTNSVMQQGMNPEEERTFLTEVIDAIERGTGKRPRGWLGPALSETFETPHLLAELGLDYILDWCNDDQPYPMNVRTGRMISIPYSVEMNDIILFLARGVTPEDFASMLIDQFDALYEDGAHNSRVMGVSLHPFLVGQPFRRKHLARVLDHVTRHSNVWLPTSDEIADWYYTNVYSDAVHHLRERRDARTTSARPSSLSMNRV